MNLHVTANEPRYRIAVVVGLATYLGHGVTWAQPAANKAVADALFAEAKKLIKQHDTAAACAKFEASLATLPQLGTQIALAACYEELGKTASAWGAFRAAASAASKVHDKRQRFAEQRATELEAKLSKLVINLKTANRIDGLELRRDGAAISPAELGTAVPVDPGEHMVSARALGRIAWSITVTVGTTEVVPVEVPALMRLPDPDAPRRRHRIIAYSIAGGGLAAIGASLVLGDIARSRWSRAQPHCADQACDQTGVDLANSARSIGNISTATFVAGAALMATGVALRMMSAPAHEDTPPAPIAFHVLPDIEPSRLGVVLQREF
jgi:hypothetical protein